MLVLAIAEQMGMSRGVMGIIFLLATVALYACIGIMSRTNDAAEYCVASRRVPAVYNGMVTGADWTSAASFIGLAGTLYLTGYGGLAYIMVWTGGYCLVAFFWRHTCASSASSRPPTFWVRGMAATWLGLLAWWLRSSALSPTWSRRSTASA